MLMWDGTNWVATQLPKYSFICMDGDYERMCGIGSIGSLCNHHLWGGDLIFDCFCGIEVGWAYLKQVVVVSVEFFDDYGPIF